MNQKSYDQEIDCEITVYDGSHSTCETNTPKKKEIDEHTSKTEIND